MRLFLALLLNLYILDLRVLLLRCFVLGIFACLLFWIGVLETFWGFFLDIDGCHKIVFLVIRISRKKHPNDLKVKSAGPTPQETENPWGHCTFSMQMNVMFCNSNEMRHWLFSSLSLSLSLSISLAVSLSLSQSVSLVLSSLFPRLFSPLSVFLSIFLLSLYFFASLSLFVSLCLTPSLSLFPLFPRLSSPSLCFSLNLSLIFPSLSLFPSHSSLSVSLYIGKLVPVVGIHDQVLMQRTTCNES